MAWEVRNWNEVTQHMFMNVPLGFWQRLNCVKTIIGETCTQLVRFVNDISSDLERKIKERKMTPMLTLACTMVLLQLWVFQRYTPWTCAYKPTDTCLPQGQARGFPYCMLKVSSSPYDPRVLANA